jgi:1-acyl-sn-glycerol-3-phosphate acyltransferase
MKRREPTISLLLYHLFKWSVVSPALHTYFRGRVYGAENVPKHDPLIIISNHASDFDPPLLSCAVRRPVAYMAKEELFRVPGLGKALAKIEDGWAVGIFPTGTRTRDGRITDAKLGAAMIAAKTQIPLLPVSLWGTEKIIQKGGKLPKPVPVTIRIGTPIAPPQSSDRETLEVTTQRCIEAIHAMHDLGR